MNRSRNMEHQRLYTDVWSLICDRESASTRVETISESLIKLQETFPELFPMPPKVMKQFWRDNLLVFASNDSDEEIQRGAEAIRSHVDYPFIMYYFKEYDSDPQLTRVLYKHTPDYELYKFSKVEESATSFWRLISKKKEKNAIFGESLPSQDKDRINFNYDPVNENDSERAIVENEGKWITVRNRKTKQRGTFKDLRLSHVNDRDDIPAPAKEYDPERVTDEKVGKWIIVASKKTRQKTTCEMLFPSQVDDRDYIYWPAKEDDFEAAKNEKGGKWILHCLDLEALDNLWRNLIPLYHKGVLVALKSCTAKSSITERALASHTKLVMCYTADANCKSSLKKAADSILISTGYDLLMYYKSNKASQFGQYRHEGFRNVSKYKFTVTGQMFERDVLGRWKKTIFNQEKDK